MGFQNGTAAGSASSPTSSQSGSNYIPASVGAPGTEQVVNPFATSPSNEYLTDQDPLPPLPGYQSTVSPSGQLLPEYQLQQPTNIMPGVESNLQSDQLNTQPLNELESYADSTGPSPWAQAQTAIEQQQQGVAAGNVAQQAEAGTQAAGDYEATHGGLTSGALQNLGRQQSQNQVTGEQGVAGQGLAAKQQIAATDAANKLGVLENLPGQEVQATQPGIQEENLYQSAAEYQDTADQAANAMNIQNAISGVQGENQYGETNYMNQINNSAANALSNAYQNQGKK